MSAKRYDLVTPSNTKIVGTYEMTPGTALISELESPDRNEKGEFELEYAGETEMHWDDQKTQRTSRSNRRLFVDDMGDIWTEDKLRTVEVVD